jgi:serine/threonine protein kinase/TolB-like protein
VLVSGWAALYHPNVRSPPFPHAVTDILARLIPALTGRYTIERELGRGGMAVVYLARDEKHHRLVALKVMLPEIVGEASAARFRREIQIAARLNHPNILTVFDSGDADDLVYYVMPFVEGESLRDAVIRERQLGIMEAVSITRQVAEALDYAHGEGVIHRDIKPANIMLQRARTRPGATTTARTPIVTDFGIARAMSGDSDSRLTATGLMVGTPTYMSPEQWSGDQHVDGRSDQYSLACVLYEMLIGEPPFNGATPMIVLARHTREMVPSLRIVRPNVPDALEQVIFAAMSKMPADRYATMGEFADALAAAVEGPGWSTGGDDLISHPSQLPGPEYTSGVRSYSSYPAPVSHTSFPTPGSAPRPHPSHPAGPRSDPSNPRTNPSPWAGPRSDPNAWAGPPTNPSLRAGPPTPPNLMATGYVDTNAPTSQFAVPKRRTKRWSIIAAIAVGLAAVSAVAWTMRPTTPERTRVMVLPFEDQGTVLDSTFADGLTEEIISRLSGIEKLGVVARASSMKYKGSTKSPTEIIKELNVDRLITGQVLWRAGGDNRQATIRVEIIDGKTGTQQELEEVDAANLNNLYTLASKITAKLQVKVNPTEQLRLKDEPTQNREAFEAYQLGTRLLRSWDSTDLKAAVVSYERATNLDPSFALALAGLGRAHAWMYQLHYDPSPRRLVFARQYIDSALSISPALPEAHLARGLYHYWGSRDYDAALSEFSLVQKALPSNAEVFHQRANLQRRLGKFEDAVENYKLSSELDPKAHQPLFSGAEALLYLRRYQEAAVWADRAIAVQPDFIDGYILKATLPLHISKSKTEARRVLEDLVTRIAPADWRPENHHWRVGLFRIVDDDPTAALARARENHYGLEHGNFLVARALTFQRFARADSARFYFDSAATFMRATIARHPEFVEAHALLGVALAGLKSPQEAVASAERAMSMLNEETDALDGPEWVINLAQVYTMIGNKPKAIELLTRAMTHPSRLSGNWLELDPIWEPLRTEEAFQKLMRNPPAFTPVVASR